MLVLPEDVFLFDVQQNVIVGAKLIRLIRGDAARLIDGAWWKLPVSGEARENEGDHHWEWRKIVGEKRNRPAWECLAVVGPDGGIEGAIVYRIDAKSRIDENAGAAYVDRLAAAPRNRHWLAKPPKYQGVGSILLFAAVRHSYSLGLRGRVSLSCLPDERSRSFYGKKGFVVICEDEGGMIDYELPVIKAEEWLRSEGCI
jgi:hypothetical protein